MDQPDLEPVRLLTTPELNTKLLLLAHLLRGLPDTLPLGNDFYQFENYEPSQEDCERFESDEFAVNNDLERRLCPNGRKDGLVLRERGPGLVAVASVLRQYTIQSFMAQYKQISEIAQTSSNLSANREIQGLKINVANPKEEGCIRANCH